MGFNRLVDESSFLTLLFSRINRSKLRISSNQLQSIARQIPSLRYYGENQNYREMSDAYPSQWETMIVPIP